MRRTDGIFIVEKKGNEIFEGFQGIIIYLVDKDGIFDLAEGYYENGQYVILKHFCEIVLLDLHGKRKKIKALKESVYSVISEMYDYEQLLEIAITEEVAKWIESDKIV